MKIINLYNHKGGVGKSTLSIHIANKLQQHGNVLLIELDDQANILIITDTQKKVEDKINNNELYPLGVLPLMSQTPIEKFIYKQQKSFDIIINNELKSLEAGLKDNFFSSLFNKIDSLSTYDFIIIDNPPSKYDLVLQCLQLSTNILIPFDCEDNSTQAVLDTLTMFAKNNINLENVQGVIPNKYLHFHQKIHNENILLIKEAISFEGSTINLYDKIKNAKAIKEYVENNEYNNILNDVITDILK
ncbi:MAG: ParA family protein [Mycoplasmatales bacterium]